MTAENCRYDPYPHHYQTIVGVKRYFQAMYFLPSTKMQAWSTRCAVVDILLLLPRLDLPGLHLTEQDS